jgi:hypothetical protein
MSNSYPYLALSRRTGIPYGKVLSLADALEKHKQHRAGDLTCWEREAMTTVPAEQIREVILVLEDEEDRRDAAAS